MASASMTLLILGCVMLFPNLVEAGMIDDAESKMAEPGMASLLQINQMNKEKIQVNRIKNNESHLSTDSTQKSDTSLTSLERSADAHVTHDSMNANANAATTAGHAYQDYHLVFLYALVFCLIGHTVWREVGSRGVFRWGKGNERFSPAAGTKDIVYISGQVGNVDTLQKTNAEGQATEALAKVEEQLKSVGSSKQKILFASISLRNKSDSDGVNKAWGKWLEGTTPPARVCVVAGIIRENALVEIVTVAAR